MDHDDSESLAPLDAKPGIILASGVEGLLRTIRPEWQAKSLIQRVQRLLPVDPSSACQRLFNAAIHDLREKILIAGVDLAKEAARRNKLPAIERAEDITENYSVARVIDLAYRIGFLSRSEWRRLERCYQIRRDLEHEDNQYEAEIEDIVYMFKTCVEVVLSRDPVQLIHLSDVQALIDAPQKTAPSKEFLHEFESAPEPRQQQILEHLVSTALDSKKADIIRQNAVDLLREFNPLTKSTVRIEIGQYIQQRISNKRLELVVAKVAYAAGVLPYLKQRQVRELFEWLYSRLREVGHHWRRFESHEQILDDLEDVGGLQVCPAEVRGQIVQWMVLCYIGEPGGYGTYGRSRPVFFSDTAAPRIERMMKKAASSVAQDVDQAGEDPIVNASIRNKFLARRYEELRDLVYNSNDEE